MFLQETSVRVWCISTLRPAVHAWLDKQWATCVNYIDRQYKSCCCFSSCNRAFGEDEPWPYKSLMGRKDDRHELGRRFIFHSSALHLQKSSFSLKGLIKVAYNKLWLRYHEFGSAWCWRMCLDLSCYLFLCWFIQNVSLKKFDKAKPFKTIFCSLLFDI